MELSVNGAPVTTAARDVAALVAERTAEARRVAVALNGDVVPRSAWGSTLLADGDVVEVLSAVAGG